MPVKLGGSHYVLNVVTPDEICTFTVSDAALENWMTRCRSSRKATFIYNALVTRFINARYNSSRSKLDRSHLLDRELLRIAVSEGAARNDSLCYTLIHND